MSLLVHRVLEDDCGVLNLNDVKKYPTEGADRWKYELDVDVYPE